MPCRLCDRLDLEPIADLGAVPLANALAGTAAEARACPRHPLVLDFCASCGLLQLRSAPPPAVLFDAYPYRTGHSSTMTAHLDRLAAHAVRAGDRVVEIGSNDGTFLDAARRRGGRVLGVDPAEGAAADAARLGLETQVGCFDAAVAEAIRDAGSPADLIVGINVLAHAPSPNEVAAGIARLLAPGGRAVIEVPALDRLLATAAIDTIYHEHHAVFSARTLDELARRHGLAVVALQRVSVHGGSWRAWLGHAAEHGMHACADVRAAVAEESSAGAFTPGRLRRLVADSDALDAQLAAAIAPHPRLGAYGAAAKATMLLNRIGLDAERLPWIADANPAKHGRFVPGTAQHIVPPSHLPAHAPDACIVFAWNLLPELRRTPEGCRYLAAGGRFIPSRVEPADPDGASAHHASAGYARADRASTGEPCVSGRVRTASATLSAS